MNNRQRLVAFLQQRKAETFNGGDETSAADHGT